MLTSISPDTVRTATVAPQPRHPERWSLPRPPSSSASTGSSGTTGATVALAVLTIASAVGLLRVFTGYTWIGPLLITACGVHATCWAVRRARLPQWAGLLIGLLSVWALPAWTVLGYSTAYGFPGRNTAVQLWAELGQAHRDFATAVTPVDGRSTGFRLLAVLGIGLAAFMSDWGAFRWRSALYGAAPPFAYFVICCVCGLGPGRERTVVVEVAFLLVFLLVHRSTVGRANQAWFGNYRIGAARWATTAGALTATAALLTAAVVAPIVATSEGHGILGWHSGLGGDGGPRQVPNPVVDLHTRLVTESNTPVFTVQSAVPSYWRLTTLDTFTGEDWISTDSYQGFRARLPGVQAVPAGTRLVPPEHFQIQQLDSVWLPDAFTPLSVTGVRGVSYDPVSDSLITKEATSDGLSYTVDSYQYLSSLDPSELESAPPVASATVSRFLQLPNSIPAQVYALARSITAGQTTEYGKALALQNFFLAPQNHFTYSLDPPDDNYDTDALIGFLFYSRTGFCQQFAGSYAVLARAIGLPTRLAVGFVTGTDDDGVYQVTDADAHTWPEVYFGPKFGWLPFEPTKSFSDPMSKTYDPSLSTSGTGTGPTAPAPPSGPTPPIVKSTKTPAGRTAVPTPNAPVSVNTVTPKTHRSAVWPTLLVVILITMAWLGLVFATRRLRWLRRRWKAHRDTASLVIARWGQVGELLNWWGATQLHGETDEEFARRAGNLVNRRSRQPAPWVPGAVLRLAGLATEARFAARVAPPRAGEAASLAQEIHRRLVRSASWRQQWRWALIPQPGRRLGWRPDRTPSSYSGGGESVSGPWRGAPPIMSDPA